METINMISLAIVEIILVIIIGSCFMIDDDVISMRSRVILGFLAVISLCGVLCTYFYNLGLQNCQ